MSILTLDYVFLIQNFVLAQSYDHGKPEEKEPDVRILRNADHKTPETPEAGIDYDYANHDRDEEPDDAEYY